jgi:hypothetical protein
VTAPQGSPGPRRPLGSIVRATLAIPAPRLGLATRNPAEAIPNIAPQIVRAAAGPGDVQRWLVPAHEALARLPADHPDRQPTSGSLRLRALGPAVFDDIVSSLPAPGWPLLAADCWLRVQHPMESRPAGQHPHTWHQDGALGHDFGAAQARPITARPMRTLWLALLDCGVHAPSLEWIEAHEPVLLRPDELTEPALLRRHGLQRRQHALLAAGDALLFDGALLHRTHVSPGMTNPRISIELRWGPAPNPDTTA